MAIATFNSFRGERSALCMVRPNKFSYKSDARPAYIAKDAFPEDIVKGTDVEIPDGYKFVPMVDKDGNACTTEPKDGTEPQPLYRLSWV